MEEVKGKETRKRQYRRNERRRRMKHIHGGWEKEKGKRRREKELHRGKERVEEGGR